MKKVFELIEAMANEGEAFEVQLSDFPTKKLIFTSGDSFSLTCEWRAETWEELAKLIEAEPEGEIYED